jgi:cardiolipin synthase
VSCRVEGPIAADFAALFELRWAEAGGEREGVSDFDTDGRHHGLRLIGDTASREGLVFAEHVDAVERARTRVWMANAYFYPSPPLIDALAGAAARGVDVRIILPETSDLPTIERASRSALAAWRRRGLQVHAYGPRMMHGKYALVDDRWCTLGSFNAIPTSVGLANEINVVVCDPGFVELVAAQFEHDLRSTHAVTGRPPGRWRPGDVLDALAGLFMRLVDRAIGAKR